MKNTFLRNCVPERPVLLVFDGHSTHLGQDVIDLAIENQITILLHSSHLLQPLDLIIIKIISCYLMVFSSMLGFPKL